MGGQPLDSASRAFFDVLKGLEKQAVELSGETRVALGIDAQPEMLDELEASAGPASRPHEPSAGDSDAAPPAEPPAETAEADAQLIAGAPPTVDAEPDLEDEETLPAAPEETPGRATHGKLFSARRAHPLAVYDVLQARYGDDWLFWEGETLWWAIRRDFGPVGELTRNKIQALRLAVQSYSPFADWDVFEKCGLSWNDVLPLFGAWQPMSPSQVAFTLAVIRELHPEAPLGHEVVAYEAAVLDQDGFVYAPEEWFPGAQALLNRKSEAAPFKDEVVRAWEAFGDRDPGSFTWRADHPLDVHIAKLLAVRTYLAERARLRAEPCSVAGASAPTSPPVP